MNKQPYGNPPRWWEPRLKPWWVRLTASSRWRRLHDEQRIESVEVAGLEHVRNAVESGAGVLIAPNHSVHYDSAVLYIAADLIKQPLYFLTAWQAFAMSSRFEQWAMQRLGAFSIDRESVDRKAFKQATSILQEAPHPLVIFPEGDIYHTSDRITPFREGAAAIAISAARRGDRPVVTIPCGIKFWYVEDPTPDLMCVLDELEERVFLRGRPDLTLRERIHRVAEAVLGLKELDFLGTAKKGRLRDRIPSLTEAVLHELETRHEITPIATNGRVAERVKVLRQHLIRRMEELPTEEQTPADVRRGAALQRDMSDLFFVMQLYSYPGDYLASESPSIERMAETVDKYEEDILDLALPRVRGRRKAEIIFGPPTTIDGTARSRSAVADITGRLESQVQSLLDELNRHGGNLKSGHNVIKHRGQKK